jgi:PAS domain S-box-containing protein
LGAPLISGNKVTGVLKLYSRQKKRVFTTLETEHLLLVASQLANLIENARLYEQNEKHKEVLVKQIIARRKVEDAIKESEEKYRTLVEQASDGIIISNVSLALLDVNEMMCTMMGYSKEELLKLSIFDIAQQEPETAEARYKAYKDGESILQERVFNRKDGTTFPVEISTIVMMNGNYLSFVRDISDRKKAEKENQLLLLRNQVTINSMLDGYILSDLNGKIIDTNPAYCKMSGYSKEELLQKYAYHLDANITEAEIQNLIAEVIKKKSIQLESRHWRKDKSIIDVEVSVSTVHFEEQIFIAAFLRDITDRKKSEEQAKLTNEHLRQLTGHLQTIREEERSRIGQEIHDQLGQHLTVLKMDVSRLKKNIPINKNKEEDLVEIISELDNCLQMVRKISADLRPSIIDDLGIIAAMEWLAEDFERRTEITTKFFTNAIELKLPQTHSIGLFRIFQESLTNVVRHAEAKEVVAELNKENGFVMLTIADNGKGFDENSVGGKRSLGLLGMRERTLLMNGDYKITSVPGKGTEVKVTVPL